MSRKTGRDWTEEEIELLIVRYGEKKRLGAIAAELKRTSKSVGGMVGRLIGEGLLKPNKQWKKPQPVDYTKPASNAVERIARTCLRCPTSFTAFGRFQRLCPNCRRDENRGQTVW